MKKWFSVLMLCIFITGCSIFTSGDKVTIKKEKKKPNTLFTTRSYSRDIQGILQDGPGRYPVDDDQDATTLPKKAIQDLKTLPPYMLHETAYNQLIYLFGRDYQELEFRLAVLNPYVFVSEERKKAKPKKETLKVNIVIVLDCGPEMTQTIPGTNQKKFDRLKEQVKNSILDLRRNIPKGISYYVMFKSYGGILNKSSKLIPLDQVETHLFPNIDEVLPGGEFGLDVSLDIVKERLKNETGGNVLNQIFLIAGSNDNLPYASIRLAKEIFESEIQGHVHAIDYGVTDRKIKKHLQAIPIGAMGEYIEANPKGDIPFDFKDQTDFNDEGYNPREYLLFKEEAWTKRMADLKAHQIDEFDTMYVDEYEQLMAATKYLKMDEKEKEKLIKLIESRRNVLSIYYEQELERAWGNYQNSKESLGLK